MPASAAASPPATTDQWKTRGNVDAAHRRSARIVADGAPGAAERRAIERKPGEHDGQHHHAAVDQLDQGQRRPEAVAGGKHDRLGKHRRQPEVARVGRNPGEFRKHDRNAERHHDDRVGRALRQRREHVPGKHVAGQPGIEEGQRQCRRRRKPAASATAPDSRTLRPGSSSGRQTQKASRKRCWCDAARRASARSRTRAAHRARSNGSRSAPAGRNRAWPQHFGALQARASAILRQF